MGDTRVGLLLTVILLVPLVGSLSPPQNEGESYGFSESVPPQAPVTWSDPGPWWSWTAMDSDRNGVHDSIQSSTGPVNVGLSFSRPITDDDRSSLEALGHSVAVAVSYTHLTLPTKA